MSMSVSAHLFFFFAFRRQSINSSLIPISSSPSLLQPFPVLSAQSWAPLPVFQKCHLTWALDSKALIQSDLGFPTRLHCLLESGQTPEQTHLISGLAFSRAWGHWCVASTFPGQGKRPPQIGQQWSLPCRGLRGQGFSSFWSKGLGAWAVGT